MFVINSLVIVCILSLCQSLNRSDAAPTDAINYATLETRSPNALKMFSLSKSHLFVPQKKDMSRVNQTETKRETATTKFLNYWSKIVSNKQQRVAIEARELTLYVPKFTRNEDGNWVAINWRPTPDKVWADTRMNIHNEFRLQTADDVIINYSPGEHLSTVCSGRSTLYNWPRVHGYLIKSVQVDIISNRAFYDVLRRQIYKHGRSEECHVVTQTRWLDYFECALRRNQRIEYLIPKYPLFQKGYWKYWKIYI